MFLFLFSRAGFTNRICLDIGAGNCLDDNTANLILFHRFKAFLVDGSERELTRGRQFYGAIAPASTPVFIPVLLTSDNLNQILEKNGVPAEIDLLSIDIDTVDLFIVERIATKARVIIVEFNNLWGPEESFSFPNRTLQVRELGKFLYGGASLAAFQKILTSKGYKLVAIAPSGYDAIYVLDHPDFREIPAVSPQSLYQGCAQWQHSHTQSLQHPIRKKEWVSI